MFLGVTVIGAESGEKCAESVKKDFCAFLLIAFGALVVGVLGGEAGCLLFILTGFFANVFGVLVNDFLVARYISRFTIYITVFL